MTTENQLAQEYENAAHTLRSLAAPTPEHTAVFTNLASWMDTYARQARFDGIRPGDWGGYDYPGHANNLHDLALQLTARTLPAPEEQ